MKLFFLLPLFSLVLGGTAIAEELNARQSVQNAYEQLDYSFQQPFVKQNAFGLNTLSALVKFPTDTEAQIAVVVKGKDGAPDITHTFAPYALEHEIPVLGLYPNHKNEVVLTARYRNGRTETKTVFIETPKANKRALFVPLHKTDTTDERYYFISEGMVFDENGHLRLDFKNGEMTYYLQGELISESRNFGLKRYSLAGELLQTYTYPEAFTSFSHGMARKPNGHFLVLGSFTGTTALFKGQEQTTQRDHIIEINDKTGEVVKKWDLAEVLNPDRSVIIHSATQSYGLNNWCHLNGIGYDADDTSLVVSCRHSGMIKIDDETGELMWVFGPKQGYEKSGRDGTGPALFDKVLTAIDSNGVPYSDDFQKGYTANNTFKWPTKTHDAQAYGQNIFSIFDNSGAVYDEKLQTTPYSVASIYRVNPDNKTVQQIWRENLKAHSPVASSVVYQPNKKDVTVYISQIADSEQNGIAYGKITRYDFDTHRVLFDSLLYRGGNTHFYRVDPFRFYQ